MSVAYITHFELSGNVYPSKKYRTQDENKIGLYYKYLQTIIKEQV